MIPRASTCAAILEIWCEHGVKLGTQTVYISLPTMPRFVESADKEDYL